MDWGGQAVKPFSPLLHSMSSPAPEITQRKTIVPILQMRSVRLKEEEAAPGQDYTVSSLHRAGPSLQGSEGDSRA